MPFETRGSYLSDERITDYFFNNGKEETAVNIKMMLTSLSEVSKSTDDFFACIEDFVNSDPAAVEAIPGIEPFRVDIAMKELPDFPFPFVKQQGKLYLDMTPMLKATIMIAIVVTGTKNALAT